jgi:hypothetical protein
MRVADILALVCALGGIVLVVDAFLTMLSSFPHWPVNTLVIALNLGMLGMACSIVVQTYSTRFRWLDAGLFLLDSWQSQLRALLMVTVLPLCALVLAVVTLPTQPTVVFPISLLAGFVVVSALYWMPRVGSRDGRMRIRRAEPSP